MADYIPGFGGVAVSEAVAGAVPVGRNSPQQVPFGLYAEQFSGTAFTAPRAENRFAWLYRLRPSASHPPFRPYEGSPLACPPAEHEPVSPNRLRWDPLPAADAAHDFLEGLILVARNGDVAAGTGMSVYLYNAGRSMERRAFFSADGEMLIVPQEGRLEIRTEFGILEVEPQMIALIPRGVKFSVLLREGPARGYVAENHGALLRLPELGPIGANGLAAMRDFEQPAAWYEDKDEPHALVQKFQGRLWATELDHSPFDVVGWHGNHGPSRYDLRRFNTINTVSFDHPDPSIFTVLTSPSERPGTANLDFVIFPPRWMVAEDTFRPPWFHRNVMSEFMGLILGTYDAKEGGFAPGGASLHNCMNGHGPDRASYAKAVAAELKPHRIENTMAFMFESCMVIRPSRWAMESASLQTDYDSAWSGFAKARLPG